MTLGERVRGLRLERNWSQSGMAKLAGICGPCLSDIEHGKRIPNYSTLCRLAKALQISLSKLFEGVDTAA